VKVLVLTNMYPTEKEPWFGCFVRDQVDDLRALGVSVDVLSFDGRSATSEYVRAAGRLRHALRSDQFDVVHAHYGLTGAVASTQRAVRTVTTFHGTDAGHVRWKRNVSWFVARTTYPVFVSRRSARLLGLPHASVIPIGIDMDLFKLGDRRAARRAMGWREEGTFVLFPGARSVPVKNAPLFYHAVDAVRAEGVDVTPVFLEGLTREQVATAMCAADVLLMTSTSEGSPLAVREALASGTPVVSVDVGDVRDVIGDLDGCSVTSRDPLALASAVRAALCSADRESLRARAAQYRRVDIAERLVGVYEALAA
jgi:teichuronic acid biosynthesis glycosyltransferase TuaC